MTILQTLSLCLVALLLGIFFQSQRRNWLLLIASLVSVYWFQPFTPIPHLDFWLPSLSITLAILIWALTRQVGLAIDRQDWITAGIVSGVILTIGSLRYLGPLCCLTPSRPPEILQIIIAILMITGVAAFLYQQNRFKSILLTVFLMIILCLFVILKTEPLATALSIALRSLTGRSVATAAAQDLRWLGFSYIAFRLLHVLRDRQSGRLPDFKLHEFLIYVFFFPTLLAGPIDRGQRFLQDLRKPLSLNVLELLQGGKRIAWGSFKKFVLADALAIIALNETKAAQTTSTVWLWVLVYAYAFRIYLDFSGYTDIAIGSGQLVGIKLPENFDRPYLKPNLTTFWNSWHMTLAQWFRAYFFNPLTRHLRSSKHPIPTALIILIGQFSSMLLIGLWHGVTWNFLIWGAWHGVGLFVHNRWSEFSRARLANLKPLSWRARLVGVASTFITFQYVLLGWIWFALPEPAQSWQVLGRLFGYG